MLRARLRTNLHYSASISSDSIGIDEAVFNLQYLHPRQMIDERLTEDDIGIRVWPSAAEESI